MSIDFQCPGCGTTLRVQAESAGKQAKCPKCGQIAQVPAAAPVAAPAQPKENPGAFAAAPDIANPYAAPSAASYQQPSEQLEGTEIRHSTLDLGDVISRSWETYKAEFGLCLGASVLFMAISFGVNMVENVINIAAAAFDPAVGGITQVFTGIAGWVFTTWLTAGLVVFYLKAARRASPQIAEIFSGGKYLLRLVLAQIVVGLVCVGILLVGCGIPALIGGLAAGEDGAGIGAVVGVAICMIPLIIIGLMVSQYQYLIVDQDMDAMESLRVSMQITKGNKLSLFLLGIVGGVIVFVGVLAFCVGFIFALPLVYVMGATAYLAMTGQLPGESESTTSFPSPR